VRAIGIINLALLKFNQHVESQIWNDDRDLNEIMKVFTVLIIVCLPQTVVGCLWGMNCTVPWQAVDGQGLLAFVGITGFTFTISVCFIAYFKYHKYF
jgi:Mg2+ and Co2+ transporter CorA